MLKRLSTYLRQMGPAWIISAVACGPATLASVCIAGASYGFKLLWVVILSAVFGATAQYLGARIGILEGRGVIATAEERLGPVWAWVLAIDAILATYLAALVLMNALVGVTSLVTGIEGPWWGIPYAFIIALALIRGGYRWFESLCKAFVGFVVCCFIVTAFQADFTAGEVVGGMLPSIPGGVDSALMIAAILGGAVHITIIGMHTYNTNARKWARKDLGLAWFDNTLSMGFAFGIYSVAIFLVAAAVLHSNQIKVNLATDAALSLGPLLGKHAMVVFLIGLWAATLSTISPTFLAGAYFIFDKMKWKVNTESRRFHIVILGGALLSAFGPFMKGSFFLLLPLMLALGLCGTPLIIAIILYLLNKRAIVGEYGNSIVLNILGGLTFLVTSVVAVRFILVKLGFV
ncbi:MAG: divalent metal cation transporter [Deltaproteobacteria bacterium]|nr:MAG: divalent metal cation transporter [Deltaproteobacteria bacterium]